MFKKCSLLYASMRRKNKHFSTKRKLHFWKFIAIGAVALFAGLRKYFGGKDKD